MLVKKSPILVFWLISSIALARGPLLHLHPQGADTLPVPQQTKQLLFYIQRSSNINTIIYDVNTLPNGKLRADNPFHIYWIRYAEQSQKEELTYIQRNFAYGVNIKSPKDNASEFSFVSYKKLKMFLQYSEADKRFIVTTMMGAKRIKVRSVFVKIEGGTFWVPKVTYVQIKGIDMTSGKEVAERFVPNK